MLVFDSVFIVFIHFVRFYNIFNIVFAYHSK